LLKAMLHCRAEGGINRGAASLEGHVFPDVRQVAVVAAQVAAVGEVKPGGKSCQNGLKQSAGPVGGNAGAVAITITLATNKKARSGGNKNLRLSFTRFHRKFSTRCIG